jgi:hypothetical protein
MADDWQSLPELSATPADDDEVLVKDTSDTTDDAAGTVKRNSYLNLLGTALAAIRSAFTPASGSGPASLALAEDTDNGSNTVSIAAPAAVASNKTASLQDVTGTLYVSGGSDVAVADGGTGVSTLGSGNVLVGAGTSPVTSTKAAPSGDFVGTTDTQTLTGKTLGAATLSGTITGAAQVVADVELRDYAETLATPQTNVTGSLTLDYADGQWHHVTHGAGNITSTTVNNWPASGKPGSLLLELKQDGGGARTWAFSGLVWIGGAPTLDTAGDKTNRLILTTRDGGSTVYGQYLGAY